jgi:hypothetical protein
VVGLIYYLAMWKVFQTAIGDVVPYTSDLDITPDAAPSKWGTHWIYHLFAEPTSVVFGTLIAGGMARDRAAVAGLIGGLGLACGGRLAIILYDHYNVEGFDEQLVDPWYQYLIGGAFAIAGPVIGYAIGEAAREARTELRWFSGISRAHFLWL